MNPIRSRYRDPTLAARSFRQPHGLPSFTVLKRRCTDSIRQAESMKPINPVQRPIAEKSDRPRTRKVGGIRVILQRWHPFGLAALIAGLALVALRADEPAANPET